MMRFYDARRGSALLIVLGMLSFMLLSSLAFAVFMRQGRSSSSFLRRTSASRELAKAALAEAVKDIDGAIGNYPHPNVAPSGVWSGGTNVWVGRVWSGGLTDSEMRSGSYGENTVPTLTLEALAYLPPSCINEVRYYSRQTATASWQYFSFDAGRYAYTAVDVSDCLDINRVLASYPRTSAAPSRLSIGYLFEDSSHSSKPSGAANWDDDFMGEFREVDDATYAISLRENVPPLVSLADFNVAFGSKYGTGGLGLFKSPFYNYVSGNDANGSLNFYDSSDLNEPYRMAEMTFVTDSYQPTRTNSQTTAAERDLDLADSANQPFKGKFTSSKSSSTLSEIMNSTDTGRDRLRNNKDGKTSICRLSEVALFDYLDADNRPASLAVPTTERHPMICAVAPSVEAKFEVTASESKNYTGDDKTRHYVETWKFTLEASKLLPDAPQVNFASVYPFRHYFESSLQAKSFTTDGRLALYFADSATVPLRLSSGSSDTLSTLLPGSGDFETETKNSVVAVKLSDKSGGISVASKFKDVQSAEDTVTDGALVADAASGSIDLLEVVIEWDQKFDEDAGIWLPPSNHQVTRAESDFAALTEDGGESKAVEDYLTALKSAKSFQNVGSATDYKYIVQTEAIELYLNCALWVKIKGDDSWVYDLVPATLDDDKTYNGTASSDAMPRTALEHLSGEGSPVIGGSLGKISFSMKTLAEGGSSSSGGSGSLSFSKGYFTGDPRFNYAPDNWYETESPGANLASVWREENENFTLSRRVCDSDIFLATSDQGYLQSVCELAYLPRLSAIGSMSSEVYGDLPTGKSERPTSLDGLKDRDFMWRSYDLFGASGTADDFDAIGFTAGESGGVRINPYAASSNVFLAAFANTPLDWRVSSTNGLDAKLAQGVRDNFYEEYAWNGYAGDSSSRIGWNELQSLVGSFSSRILGDSDCRGLAWYSRNSDERDAWEDVYRDFFTNGGVTDESKLCGITLDNAKICSTDRKFLYGYWRDCFAVRQQLFLVFVRAEPAMLGGGVASSAAPQLGARAVALVWRDPYPNASDSGSESTSSGYVPHRTRVLFYHQLD